MPMQGSFDATQFAPKQVGATHPIGKFPVSITGTSIEPTKDQTGGMFIVEFTSAVGSIVHRYNLWNASAKAVEIAHGQLSALCHATGIFRLDWANDGAALRNARLQIEVAFQKGEEPSAEKPVGGYTEVRKVFDANGNEPGRPPNTALQPQQSAPMTQQPSGQWGQSNNPPPNNPPNNPPSSNQWGQPNSPPSNPQGGWQQNQPPQSGNPPPWGQQR